MKQWLWRNGREIVGWLLITLFVLVSLNHIGNLGYTDRTKDYIWFALDFSVIALAWLWLNKKH
jgi:hypothetical protein